MGVRSLAAGVRNFIKIRTGFTLVSRNVALRVQIFTVKARNLSKIVPNLALNVEIITIQGTRIVKLGTRIGKLGTWIVKLGTQIVKLGTVIAKFRARCIKNDTVKTINPTGKAAVFASIARFRNTALPESSQPAKFPNTNVLI